MANVNYICFCLIKLKCDFKSERHYFAVKEELPTVDVI